VQGGALGGLQGAQVQCLGDGMPCLCGDNSKSPWEGGGEEGEGREEWCQVGSISNARASLQLKLLTAKPGWFP
jgi:hypothetical protein